MKKTAPSPYVLVWCKSLATHECYMTWSNYQGEIKRVVVSQSTQVIWCSIRTETGQVQWAECEVCCSTASNLYPNSSSTSCGAVDEEQNCSEPWVSHIQHEENNVFDVELIWGLNEIEFPSFIVLKNYYLSLLCILASAEMSPGRMGSPILIFDWDHFQGAQDTSCRSYSQLQELRPWAVSRADGWGKETEGSEYAQEISFR